MTPSLISAGTDILLEITNLLPRPDVLHLSLTCSAIFSQVVGLLYASVELCQADHCVDTLGMLAKHPEIARHVQRLVVKPGSPPRSFLGLRKAGGLFLDEYRVANAVKAVAPRLDALGVFVWAGEECPMVDDMWRALRMHCLMLKTVGVSFGSVLPSIKSHLFDFRDLHGFKIKFEAGFYRHMLFEVSPETEPVFKRLWGMLINRCPDLRELAISTNNTTSVDPVDAHRLCHGRWPNLRRLQLGNVTVDWMPNAAGDRTPFLTFLRNHDSLEGLHLSTQAGISSEDLEQLDPDSLPNLTHFSGSINHLQAIPHASTLKSVHIPQALVIRELTPVTLSNVLQRTSSVSTLKLKFVVQSGYDGLGVLRSIASSCPQLRHLDLTCSQRNSFSLDTFSRNIRPLSKLRSFSLVMVEGSGDETMCEGATRVARLNPRVNSFAISYIGVGDTRVVEKGEFELSCDDHGLPVSLFTRHRRLHRVWGSGMRSYRCELRPAGHPGLATMSWIDLALDKGHAGREFRMLTLCILLVFISVGAVVY